eukprot:229873_1
MTTCFKQTMSMYRSFARMTLDRRMLFPLSKHSLCATTELINEYDEMDSSAKECENKMDPIDHDWQPEHRYHDFLKSYCTQNDLDDKKWKDIAAKLDTVSSTLQNWVERASYNLDSNQSNPNVEFAQLIDLDGQAQREPQILLTRPNLSVDVYWPTSLGAVPALHSLVLINNKYIACVMKHLAVTHLRCIIIAQLNSTNDIDVQDDPKKWRKHVLNAFPMIDWEPIHNDQNVHSVVGSQNIIAFGYRFKIPIIRNGVVSSAGQIIESELSEDNITHAQSNAGVKQKLRSLPLEGQPQVFWSGIKYIDLMNPLVKHGINVIITAKGTQTDIFKDIARNWSHKYNTVYADIFEDTIAAVQTRNEIYGGEGGGTLTMVAGTQQDSDFFKLQTVITAATLSKNGDETTLFICPNGNAINQSINHLHRACCGALSHLKFQHNDDIGHKPYDWIKPRSKRHKPQPAAEMYLNYGIEPVLNGATYIIGLQMDANEIRDIRIKGAAYFPWSDSVTILCPNDDDGDLNLDVAHSSSKVLSETPYGLGLRRLYSDYHLVSQTDSDHGHCVALWNDIKQLQWGPDHCAEMHGMLVDKHDHDGNMLLNMKAKTENETRTESTDREEGNDHNPLVAILESSSNDLGQDLMTKLNKLHQLYVESAPNTHDPPEILIRSKFDHGGFIKSTKLNVQIELYTDHKLKYGISIGQHCIVFINKRLVKVPQHYGYEKKNKQNSNEEHNELDHGIGNAFERFSSISHDMYDAQQQFGLDILRYEKGKPGNRHDFLTIVGELKEDVHDICIFMFGHRPYNGQTSMPFLLQKRVGPDALPRAATHKKKKKKGLQLQASALTESSECVQHVIETLKRKEFVLK